jgi:hypothetical protein
LYALAGSLARKSGVFFASAPELAAYFGVAVRTVYYWLAELENKGFFLCLERGDYSTRTPSKFRPIPHKDWQEAHPGACATKRETPASGKGNPLISTLWALSGGRVRFYPSQTEAIRRLASCDQEIELEFRRFWATLGESPEKAVCRRAPRSFIAWLRSTPAERAERLRQAAETHKQSRILAGALTAGKPNLRRRLATAENPIFAEQSAIGCGEKTA